MTVDEIIRACQILIAFGGKPTLPEVRPLIDAYYDLDGNGAGGELHIVLDDNNVETHFIRWCFWHAKRQESRALCLVLLMLSNSQRRKL